MFTQQSLFVPEPSLPTTVLLSSSHLCWEYITCSATELDGSSLLLNLIKWGSNGYPHMAEAATKVSLWTAPIGAERLRQCVPPLYTPYVHPRACLLCLSVLFFQAGVRSR